MGNTLFRLPLICILASLALLDCATAAGRGLGAPVASPTSTMPRIAGWLLQMFPVFGSIG